ncbi:MAG: TonB-dependent receptor [Bacteroidota bacterium]
MKKLTLLFILLTLSFKFYSQEKRTISGFITNERTGEKLIGATIYDTVSKKGAGTNEYGYFSLTIPSKDAFIRVSYLGLKTKYTLCPKGRTELNIALTDIQDLEEVTISSEGAKRVVEGTSNGTIELQLDKVEKLPLILGEKDVLRVLQLLPGVKSGGEASSGIYVRGGGPDQNLILLDGVPVYNASHLFGFFSVFNSDALSNVTMIKGGFPARYGGRVSSVLDMRMKEGNMKNYNVEGSIGLISSRILVEGPIKKDKTAFSFSARRTYLDLLYRPFLLAQKIDGGFFFHDFNTKIHHKINKNNHIFVSGYFGLDKVFAKEKGQNFYDADGNFYKNQYLARLQWGNSIGAIRWNHIINPKLFLNTTATFSKYKFLVGFEQKLDVENVDGTSESENFSVAYNSGIKDWALKTDFTYFPDPNHNIRFGVSEVYHTFTPGVTYVDINVNNFQLDTAIGSNIQYSHELSLYAEDDYKITNRLKINFGLHHAIFLTGDKTYHALQPRLSTNFMLDENSSLKLGVTRMAQFLHLLSNTGIGLPTDLWVPATERVKPVLANQVSLGYYREILKKMNFSVEGYYKKMNNLIQYKEGADFLSAAEDWQDKIVVGEGWTYGAEVFIEKKKGKFTGWIGYTLSWSERQFDDLNMGEKFFYRYDRRNDLSVVATYDINEFWDLGLVFVYGTGNAVTIGSQNYSVAPNIGTNFYPQSVTNFDQLNGYRMPNYHRMDFGANYKKDKEWGHSVISFSVYNLYNRQNPFLLYQGYNKAGNPALMQVSLFQMIPSFSWKFKFDFEKIKKNKVEKLNKTKDEESK